MPPAPELVTDVAGLERLRPAWSRLFARVPEATPFQAPEWLIPWWRHIGEGELLTLALHADGELAALLPLYVYEGRLLPVGIGTTDYLDALVLPGHDAALHHLAAHAQRFARAEWPQLRAGAALLAAAAPAGWQEDLSPADPCPCLRLPARLEALGEVVSRKTLRDWRTQLRRAEPVAFEDATEANLPELLAALIRLHGARWATRGEGGVLADPRVQAMQAEALPALLRAGLLRMFALRRAGAVAAVLLALADPPGRAGRRLYLYLSGFDPALERISPGLLLVGEAVRRAIEEGFAVVDFLRGRERYKYFWGAEDVPTWRRILVPD